VSGVVNTSSAGSHTESSAASNAIDLTAAVQRFGEVMRPVALQLAARGTAGAPGVPAVVELYEYHAHDTFHLVRPEAPGGADAWATTGAAPVPPTP
jgi:hypothetical protein